MSDIAYILLKANNKALTKERDDAERVLQDVLSILEDATIENEDEWAVIIAEARVRLVNALERKRGLERLADFYCDQYAKHEMGEASVFDDKDEE